jgi:hypothetical protein
MGAWSRLREEVKDLRVVIVARTMSRDVFSECAANRKKGAPLEVALDPDGTTADRWNATWDPRSYLIDESGRLAWAQPVTTMTPQAPVEAARLLQTGARVALTPGPRGTSSGP